MGVLNITYPLTGQADAVPNLLYINTTDTFAQVTTAGYLNANAVAVYGKIFSNKQAAIVYTTDDLTVLLQVSVNPSNGQITLSSPPQGAPVFTSITLAAGTAAVPSLNFTGDTDTGIYHIAANTVGVSCNGTLAATFATTGLAVVGAFSATTTVSAGTNVSAGSSGVAGTITSFPATAANGSLIIAALNAGGAFNTTIRNSVMGQSSVVSIPDPGAATSTFVLNNATANSGTAAGSWGNAVPPTPSKVMTVSIGGVLYYVPLVAQNT